MLSHLNQWSDGGRCAEAFEGEVGDAAHDDAEGEEASPVTHRQAEPPEDRVGQRQAGQVVRQGHLHHVGHDRHLFELLSKVDG